MINKKYELTNNTITISDKTLYQIRALHDIPRWNVTKGDFGGYIEKEENLSHDGDCWVSGNAQVYGDAQVSGNARVSGNAWVSGNAQVYGDAWVSGNVWVSGNAQVYGDAQVSGYVWVSGNARVSENANITKISDILVIGPIGSRNDYTTFYNINDNIGVVCGYFNGTIDEFETAVNNNHGSNIFAKEYNIAISLAKIKLHNN